MYRSIIALTLVCAVAVFATPAHTHTESTSTAETGVTRSTPGANPWNTAQEPDDWWHEINERHGHVGPWNVLGWRIGKAALRELDAEWGEHSIDIVCYLPMQTPYTCLVDGVAVGTGNSQGRMDLRMAEAMALELIHVTVRRTDMSGPILVFQPEIEYLHKIESRPVEELESLSKECRELEESRIFSIRKIYGEEHEHDD